MRMRMHSKSGIVKGLFPDRNRSSTGPHIYMKETMFYVFLASSVIFDARND
jgi:hypothetical protein